MLHKVKELEVKNNIFAHWGQGQITPMGQYLSTKGSYYHSEHFAVSFRRIALNSDFT